MAVATLLVDSPVESVKQAVKSASTCSNATLLSLQALLRGSSRSSPDIENNTSRRNEKFTKGSAVTARSRATRGVVRSKTPVKAAALHPLTDKDGARLSCQEKLVLATEVFNTTLKTLSDALKVSGSKRQLQSCDEERPQSRAHKDPLQPTSPNRIIKSPRKTKTSKPAQLTASVSDNGILAVAECARLALSCLRALKSENMSEGNAYPNLQLEQGACVLAGRLISLGLNDLAYKELRSLKRRIQQYLDSASTGRKATSKDGQEEEAGRERMSDLLTFANMTHAKSLYGLLVTFQANAMRLISSERRASTVQKVYPSLQLSNLSSPAKVIMAAFESGSLPGDKAALQLQLLSNTVLSLGSSTQKSNDSRSTASREHLKPITILILQLLSLEIRCLGWKVSGHVCDEGKEMWDLLARYLANFSQQSKEVEKPEFVTIYKIILRLQSAVAATKRKPSNNLKTVPNSAVKIAIILGQLAQEAGCFEEALKLFAEALTPLSLGQCLSLGTVRCKIASVYIEALKSGKSSQDSISNSLLEATSALGLPLKGSAGDLDELLVEAAKLKKLSMSWFGNVVAKNDRSLDESDIPKRIHEYLHGFIRFLRRYIGHQPAAESEPREHELFQKRASLSKNVALAAVDSALAIGKLSVMSQRPPWEEVLSIFTDCLRLLITLQCAVEEDSGSCGVGNCGMGLVKLSNLFWSRYLKEKELGKDYRELLPLLKHSTSLLSSCSPSQRNTGLAALKFERLAHLYLEGNMGMESEKAFRQSIKDHIDSGVLDQIVSDAVANHPHRICQDPKSGGFALGRVLSAFIRIKMRRRDSKLQDIFDDDSLGSEQRGLILEWQMGILAELNAHACSPEDFRYIFSSVVSKLLDVYSPERYPIRRLRVILRALRFTLEHPNSLNSTLLQGLVDESVEGHDSEQGFGEDSVLERFVTHINNSLRVTLGLHNGELRPDELGEVVSSWTSMTRGCHNWKSLESCIDDTEYWILQMRALIDYTEVHGLWKVQLSVLELVLRVMERQEGGDFSDTMIILSRLALQYCRLGHCKKAGGLLARADWYLNQQNISSLATISYKLAQVEYFLEIGDVEKATSTLSAARALYEKNQNKDDLANCSVQSKIAWERLVADAAFIHSRLSCAQGSINHALFFAKLSVRLNCRIWAKVERLSQRKQERAQVASANSDIDSVIEGVARLDVSQSAAPDSSITYSQGAPFWPHVGSHHTCLLNLANLSAHHGLFQDAIYYGEQALKINKTLHANIRQIASQAQLASHWILGGHVSEGQDLLKAASETSKQLESSIELVSLQMGLAALYRVQGHHDDELHALNEADNVISKIIDTDNVDSISISSTVSDLEDKMDKLRIRGNGRSRPQPQVSTTRRTRAMTSSSRSSSRRAPKATDNSSSAVQSKSLLRCKGDVLLQQAACSRALRDFEKATSLLNDAREFAVSNDSKVLLQIGESEHLLADAIRRLATHHVYCVLPESTISLPSLQSASGTADGQSSSSSSLTAKSSTTSSRRQKAPAKGTRSRAQKATEDFSTILSKAGDCLKDILNAATMLGSTLDSHAACRLMSRVSMLSYVTTSGCSATGAQSPANVNGKFCVHVFLLAKG